MELSRIVICETNDEQVIVLKETGGERSFPISIGIYEAAAIDGKIQATEVALEPTSDDRGAKLVHTFGAPGGPKVTMRSTGGDVVIRKVS